MSPDNPVVGLVVPAQSNESEKPARGLPKSQQREVARDLRLAAAELEKAADAIEAMPSVMLEYQRKNVEIEPRAWVNLASRFVEGVRTKMGWGW